MKFNLKWKLISRNFLANCGKMHNNAGFSWIEYLAKSSVNWTLFESWFHRIFVELLRKRQNNVFSIIWQNFQIPSKTNKNYVNWFHEFSLVTNWLFLCDIHTIFYYLSVFRSCTRPLGLPNSRISPMYMQCAKQWICHSKDYLWPFGVDSMFC